MLGERFVGIGLSTDPDYERQRKRRTFFNRGFHRELVDNLHFKNINFINLKYNLKCFIKAF